MKKLKLNPLEEPCTKECPNRKVGCHAQCGAYMSYRIAADDVRKERDVKLKELDYFNIRHIRYADSEARRKKRGHG